MCHFFHETVPPSLKNHRIFQIQCLKNPTVLSGTFYLALTKGRSICAFKHGFRVEGAWFGASYRNPAPHGDNVQVFEEYNMFEDAQASKYHKGLVITEQLWTPVPEKYLK